VNAYEGKTGMVLFAGKLCDPCLSALRVRVRTKMALYKYSSFPFQHRSLPQHTDQSDPMQIKCSSKYTEIT